MIRHHLSPDLMFDYATGSLPEALSLIAASHVSMCPSCQESVDQYEALGGVLLSEIEPAETDGDLLKRTLARLDDPDPEPQSATIDMDDRTRSLIPPPLRPYLNRNLDRLGWRRIGGSIAEFRLPIGVPGFNASLMRFQAGKPVFEHTHEGTEHTLVLSGGYTDHLAAYRRGDVSVADPAIRHRPVADEDEDCICLVVLDAPTRLTGPFGRLLNPFLNR